MLGFRVSYGPISIFLLGVQYGGYEMLWAPASPAWTWTVRPLRWFECDISHLNPRSCVSPGCTAFTTPQSPAPSPKKNHFYLKFTFCIGDFGRWSFWTYSWAQNQPGFDAVHGCDSTSSPPEKEGIHGGTFSHPIPWIFPSQRTWDAPPFGLETMVQIGSLCHGKWLWILCISLFYWLDEAWINYVGYCYLSIIDLLQL